MSVESEYIYTHKTVERVWDKEESSFILGYSSSWARGREAARSCRHLTGAARTTISHRGTIYVA